ncbi:hypothetical protein NE865_10401 [Phthorimaea operculella]|nr:hypothetical protein NE865_10401 [Phthorimaea operculella]
MDDGDPVSLSKGINLREVMTSGSEFQIDMDFKKKPTAMLNADDDLFPDLGDEDDSDSEDVLNLIEETTERKMLASPEYHSFDELAKKMIDCEPGGKVKILIFEEGDGPLVPVDGEVKFHYAGYWEKASIPFDSSLTMNQGKPVTQRLGVGSLIPGVELGLTTVKGPTAHFMLLDITSLHKYLNIRWGITAVKQSILSSSPCTGVVPTWHAMMSFSITIPKSIPYLLCWT